MPNSDRCASAHEAPCDSPVTEHCFVCGVGMCAGHIFECRQCQNPMCYTCWKNEGKDLCPACKVATP